MKRRSFLLLLIISLVFLLLCEENEVFCFPSKSLASLSQSFTLSSTSSPLPCNPSPPPHTHPQHDTPPRDVFCPLPHVCAPCAPRPRQQGRWCPLRPRCASLLFVDPGLLEVPRRPLRRRRLRLARQLGAGVVRGRRGVLQHEAAQGERGERARRASEQRHWTKKRARAEAPACPALLTSCSLDDCCVIFRHFRSLFCPDSPLDVAATVLTALSKRVQPEMRRGGRGASEDMTRFNAEGKTKFEARSSASHPLPFNFSNFTQAATRPDMPLADIMVSERILFAQKICSKEREWGGAPRNDFSCVSTHLFAHSTFISFSSLLPFSLSPSPVHVAQDDHAGHDSRRGGQAV